MKHLNILFTLSLLFSSLNGLAQECSLLSQKTQKQLQKAKIERDAEKKLEILSKALSKTPEEAAIHYEIAELYMQQGNLKLRTQNSPTEGEQLLKKAAFYYQTSIQKCKSYHSKSFYNLGNIFFSMGKEKEALFCYKSLIEFETKHPNRLKPNYQSQKQNALKIIQELEFDDKMRANPVPFSPSIVRNVSTGLDEYFPMISPDNDLLFYTRKVDRTSLGDIAANVVEEFTISSKQVNSNTFDQGNPLESPFNDGSFNNYGSATLSVDNREMIICACRKERVYSQNYLNCDLYASKFIRSGQGGNDFEWSPLVNLGTNINTKDGWEAQPSLSSDGQTLFFTSIRTGSRDNDIYISKKQADGTWGPARPFDEINTDGKDKSPFFHQDGETLYFVSTSSTLRKGMGGLDIFYIRRDGDSWTTPQNIGYPINSPEDELGIFVSTSGRIAYFSSYKDGDWNIYAFNLYKEARPEEVVIVKGSLATSSGEQVTNTKVRIHYNDTQETQEVQVNQEDGTYAAVVKVNESKNISIVAEKENGTFAISQLDLRPLQSKESTKIAKPQIDRPKKEVKPVPNTVSKAPRPEANDITQKQIPIQEMVQTNAPDIAQPITEDRTNSEQTKEHSNATTETISKESLKSEESEEASLSIPKKEPLLKLVSYPKSSESNASLEAMKPLNDSKALKIQTITIDTVLSGSKFELNDVLFDSESFALLEECTAILDLFAGYLIKNQSYFINIEGHTDNIGDAQKNLLLSEKRAQEVKAYLITKGVGAKRLQAKGFGETKPKFSNDTEALRKKNRRTECQIVIE